MFITKINLAMFLMEIFLVDFQIKVSLEKLTLETMISF